MKFQNIEVSGQWESGLTYNLVAGAVAGDAVTQTAALTAGRGTAGAPFLGKLVTPEADARGTVMMRGVVIVACVAGLTPGFLPLTVDGAGKVTTAAGGRNALVIGVVDGLAAIYLP